MILLIAIVLASVASNIWAVSALISFPTDNRKTSLCYAYSNCHSSTATTATSLVPQSSFSHSLTLSLSFCALLGLKTTYCQQKIFLLFWYLLLVEFYKSGFFKFATDFYTDKLSLIAFTNVFQLRSVFKTSLLWRQNITSLTLTRRPTV